MSKSRKRKRALELYEQCHSVTKAIVTLGYPKSRQAMYKWLKQRNEEAKAKAPRRRINNSPEHPLHPSAKIKLAILHRCFIDGENVQLVSEETGYSRASIYCWRRKYHAKGLAALMNTRDDPRGELKEGSPSSVNELDILKQQLKDMQMEIDILKETINVLKKGPGVNMGSLKNREKAVIVDALKNRYSLPSLLKELHLPKSSYYYQEDIIRKADKYTRIRRRIVEIFRENKSRYGYGRIHGMLQRENVILSEKVIRRIMKEEHLTITFKKRIRYNSYKGEKSL